MHLTLSEIINTEWSTSVILVKKNMRWDEYSVLFIANMNSNIIVQKCPDLNIWSLADRYSAYTLLSFTTAIHLN